MGKTLIKLLLQKHSDLGLHCFSRPFLEGNLQLHLLKDAVVLNFCCLLINFAYSLDLDQAQQNSEPDLDPNCLAL